MANLRKQVDTMNATVRPPTGEERDTPTQDPCEPHLGDTVEDTAAKKFGRVLGFVGPYVQLRPIGGGIEWDASAGVALANARSRGECP